MSYHFFIHTGNRTEALFAGVELLVEADRSPLQDIVFLVQGRGMERWLQQRLAARFGVWLGGRFPFPQTFFDQLAGDLDADLSCERLQREQIRWRIEALLREPPFSQEPLLKPMLRGAGGDRRRFLLAEQVANLFDQYQIYRADWLAAWTRGVCITDNPHERWQMRLWQALNLSPHRGELWQGLIDRLNSSTQISNLPDQVFAFGMSFMPPLMLQALQALSRHVPVHLFTLSPTEDFWADLPSRRQQLKAMLLEGEAGVTDIEAGFHPLLLALGRQGAHFQHLLLEADGQVYDRMEYFQSPDVSTLLGRLQQDLLLNRAPDEIEKAEGVERNILFHRCHTPQREVEVLRDRILALMAEDPSLSFNDIVVMAPDLTPYRSFIESLFADFPHTVADRSIATEAPALQLLNDWLVLLQGRLDWDEVFGFLHQVEVQSRLRLSAQQLAQLYEVVVEQGQVRWGLAGDQHRNHWRDGLQRLLLGSVMHAAADLWQGHAPVTALEGTGIQRLSPLLALFDLIEDWLGFAQQAQPAQAWAEKLHQLVEFFYGADAPERLPLVEAIEAWRQETSVLGDAPISLETLASWAQSLGAERRSSAGFLSHGITFCDLLPMRSIPIKVVFLLGMDERSFPRPHVTASFDLMQAQFRIGDRDLRAEDRYTFLELLLSVRDRLEILWQGLSADKNTPQPPAQVVMELRDTLAHHYGVALEEITLSHKAFPFHSDYFVQGGKLQGRLIEDFAICRALQQTEKNLSPLWQHPIGWSDKTLPLQALYQALSDPVNWALAQAGISVHKVKELPEPREKLTVNDQDRWDFHDAIQGDSPAEQASRILRRWQAEGRWPLSTAAEQAVRDGIDLVADLERKLDQTHDLGNPLAAERHTLTVGQWTLTHSFRYRHEGGQRLFHPYPLKKQALHYWLSHLLLNAVQGQQTTWVGHLEGKEKLKPVVWRLAPLSSEVAIEQLKQWLVLFDQVLQAPPLWRGKWMMQWLKDKAEKKRQNWEKAAALSCGLRIPGYKEPNPDETWLLYVRHLDRAALQQRLADAYEKLQPVLSFWQAHQEHIQ
ncbi:MAG TPA: exonuclease V subunit gamma [Sulfurivirga caldicuralii]|nr:exonuclease V subunit gamma [Sulfurivirga caldicuralii]